MQVFKVEELKHLCVYVLHTRSPPLCLCHSQPLHWLFSQVSDGHSAEHKTCSYRLSTVTEFHGGDHSSSGRILTDRWVFHTKYYQAELILLSVIIIKKICTTAVRIPLTWTLFFSQNKSSDLQVKKDTDTQKLQTHITTHFQNDFLESERKMTKQLRYKWA